jgi:Putative transposase of IS4/5 family (DUF4096)/Recombinase zinc beta ribbon domain
MGLVARDDGWRMPDWLWERIGPLLPEPPPHPLGCHRPRVPDRDAMDAILLLRTGMQWNALNLAPQGRRAAGALGQGELCGGARLAHQPRLCGRVRVRPHPPAEAARRRRAGAAQDGRAAARGMVRLPARAPSGLCVPARDLATRERLRANVRPRGEGGGAAREGQALLQGLARCGRCGRRMQVAYSGNGGRVVRYACVRGHQLHATERACASRSAACASTGRSRRPSWRRSPRAA